MEMLKKCNARNNISAAKIKGRHSISPVGSIDRDNCSGVDKNEAREKTLTFAEDFMMEHSHSSMKIAMVGIAGIHSPAPRETHKPSQAYGFPS